MLVYPDVVEEKNAPPYLIEFLLLLILIDCIFSCSSAFCNGFNKFYS